MMKIDTIHIFPDTKTEQAFFQKVHNELLGRVDNADKPPIEGTSLFLRPCEVFKSSSVDKGSELLAKIKHIAISCTVGLNTILRQSETPEEIVLGYIEFAGEISDAVAMAIILVAINDAEGLYESEKMPLLNKMKKRFPDYIKGFETETTGLKSDELGSGIQALVEKYGLEAVLQKLGASTDLVPVLSDGSLPALSAGPLPPLSAGPPPPPAPALKGSTKSQLPNDPRKGLFASILAGKTLKKSDPSKDKKGKGKVSSSTNPHTAALQNAVFSRRGGMKGKKEAKKQIIHLDRDGFCKRNTSLEKLFQNPDYHELNSYREAESLYRQLLSMKPLSDIYAVLQKLSKHKKLNISNRLDEKAFFKAFIRFRKSQKTSPEINAFELIAKTLYKETKGKIKEKRANFLAAVKIFVNDPEFSDKRKKLQDDNKALVSGARTIISTFKKEVEEKDDENWA